ncbi:hypothetical protein ACOMHN_064363 [Nucella lapillus]
MSLVRFPDAAGKTLLVMQYGQQPYKIYQKAEPETLANMHNIQLRDDDIILCSYPKTGCHWLWEIVYHLRAGTTEMGSVYKINYMIENTPEDQQLKLPPQRILNTHVLFHQLPQKVQDGKAKIIFLYRNPKDVAVSFYNHHRKIHEYEYQGEFSDYLPGLFLKGKVDFGSYFDYIRDWEREMDSRPGLPVFMVSYEELHADTFKKAKELAEFMGSSVDNDTIRGIVDKCSFNNMRERKGPFWTALYGEPVMYRRGRVGDWKNWFTAAHSEMMDEVIHKEMEGSRFCFQYTL